MSSSEAVARAEGTMMADDGGGAGGGAGDVPVGNRAGRFRVSVSSQSVVQQARLMDSAGTAWHAVKYGNLEVREREREEEKGHEGVLGEEGGRDPEERECHARGVDQRDRTGCARAGQASAASTLVA
jgi:hypothetical protein